MLRYLLTS